MYVTIIQLFEIPIEPDTKTSSTSHYFTFDTYHMYHYFGVYFFYSLLWLFCGERLCHLVFPSGFSLHSIFSLTL